MEEYVLNFSEMFVGKKADRELLRKKLPYIDSFDGSNACNIEFTHNNNIYIFCCLNILVDESSVVKKVELYIKIDYLHDRYDVQTTIEAVFGCNYEAALEILREVIPEEMKFIRNSSMPVILVEA